jgi:tetratricopeptide (TPR) repeat protein
MRTWSTRVTILGSVLLLSACGSKQRTEEVVVVDEPAIQDIPGVNPAALASFNAGISAMQQTPTNYRLALSSFERAFELDGDFWEALENIGLVQMDLGMHARAAETFRQEDTLINDLVSRGWPVSPRPEVQLNLGKALALAGDQVQAAQAFNGLLERDPGNTEALANLAALSLQSGNIQAARDYVGDLLEMSRNDVGALNVLALSFKREGDMGMAGYLWESTQSYIAETLDALGDESQYEGLTEDEADALRRYNSGRIDRLLKVQSDISNELGVLAWASGDHDAAESHFRSAVSLNGSNAAAQVNVGTIYLDYADFESACYHFSEALALRPRDEMAMIGLGACLFGQGEVDASWDAFEAASREHRDNTFAPQRLGDIAFTERNDLTTAIEWYNRNLQIRGLTAATCDRSSDRVCATVNTALELQRQNTGTP